MLWLSGCGTGGFETQGTCPPVVEYSAAEQMRAAAELNALPEGAKVVLMLRDYAVLRDQVRVCR